MSEITTDPDFEARATRQQLLLQALCTGFVRQHAALLSDDVAPLQASIPDLVQFSRILRQKASAFVTAGVSDSFWHVIDALSFYEDATTDRWPLITTERRAFSLKISEEMVQA